MSGSLADRVRELARTAPQAPAYWFAEQSVGWAEYDARATRLARVWVELGLGAGERVAVLLPDGPGVHAALLSAEKAGLVAVGIGPRAGAREIAHLLQTTGAAALVTGAEHQGTDTSALVGELRASGVPIRHQIVSDGELALAARLSVDGKVAAEPADARAIDAALEVRRLGPDDLFLLNSTSGTTGMPKVVRHDQQRWFAFHEFAVRTGCLDASDIFMSLVPAPFGFGIWTSHVTPSLLGAPTVLLPRFDADAALEAVERHRVTVLAAVSTQFILMLEAASMGRRDLSSLRALYTGGEAVPYSRAAEFEERTGACVLQFYGSNETGAVSGTALSDSRDKRLRTAGRPIPEMNLRLFDTEGREVSEGRRGQPGVRGPTLSQGYYGDAAANRGLIRDDGWMMLGDVVELDDEGYLHVVGRTDDFIIRGGKNISGPAVEEAVASHPAISLAAAVAMPDPIFGERVCAFVELSPGARAPDLDSLVAYLTERGVSKETFPERLEVVDQLPRGSGGKLQKQQLRDLIRERLARETGGTQ